MAAVSQPVAQLNEPTGTLTVTITFDSITLLVTSVTVVNNLGHDYTFTVTNTLNPVQTAVSYTHLTLPTICSV